MGGVALIYLVIYLAVGVSVLLVLYMMADGQAVREDWNAELKSLTEMGALMFTFILLAVAILWPLFLVNRVQKHLSDDD